MLPLLHLLLHMLRLLCRVRHLLLLLLLLHLLLLHLLLLLLLTTGLLTQHSTGNRGFTSPLPLLISMKSSINRSTLEKASLHHPQPSPNALRLTFIWTLRPSTW